MTDNGAQYHTWRGKSAFCKLCERRGIRQIVASPRRPQTLGKVERFWGTLWREFLEGAIFQGLDEARQRIGQFLGWYNFQRTHQGIDGLVPADRYFEAAPEVLATLKARVADNAKDLALHGEPRQQVYLTGRVGEESISLHGEGTKVVLTRESGEQSAVDLAAPGKRQAPGTSELDEVLRDLTAAQRRRAEAVGVTFVDDRDEDGDEAAEVLEGAEPAAPQEAQGEEAVAEAPEPDPAVRATDRDDVNDADGDNDIDDADATEAGA